MKSIKLKSATITVMEIGTHILTPIAKLFNKKITGHVVKLHIVGDYTGGLTQHEDFNLMVGDTLTLSVNRGKIVKSRKK